MHYLTQHQHTCQLIHTKKGQIRSTFVLSERYFEDKQERSINHCAMYLSCNRTTIVTMFDVTAFCVNTHVHHCLCTCAYQYAEDEK